MGITIDWLGVSTFRLTIDDLVIFLDAYIDRVPAAPPVGISTADIDRADYIFIGHSHFDHLWGAERIAERTGATVVGSYETVRLLHDSDSIPDAQLLAVAGGEPVHLSPDVRVRVFPSLHSCIWATMAGPTGESCLGDLGLSCQERREREARLTRMLAGGDLGKEVSAHLLESDRHPRSDGGALAYLIETPRGSILWKDTSGHWSGIIAGLRPDVALLAAAGRGNVDGEPVQGSLGGFIASEVEVLRPRKVALCHHDNWMPPLTSLTDVGPIKHEIARRAPEVEFVEMPYLSAYPILG
ncbi:MAG TPA: MBL fold metallo-hydrolase [Candidatus Binataceae bacterium]|nr:MBL fold metallo-hydrolase [Candidatus Binataceae bacterium]